MSSTRFGKNNPSLILTQTLLHGIFHTDVWVTKVIYFVITLHYNYRINPKETS